MEIKMFRIFWLFLVVAGIIGNVLFPGMSAAEKTSAGTDCIQIKADEIQSSCRDIPLTKILTTIYTNKGIDFSISEENLHDKVTATFAYMPMTEGVKKFLAGRNYSFIYDREGKLIKVVYLGKKKSVGLSSIINPPIDSKKEKKVEEPLKTLESVDDRMTVSDSGEEAMTISSGGEKMDIKEDGEKMDIKEDGDVMTVDSDGEKMEIQ